MIGRLCTHASALQPLSLSGLAASVLQPLARSSLLILSASLGVVSRRKSITCIGIGLRLNQKVLKTITCIAEAKVSQLSDLRSGPHDPTRRGIAIVFRGEAFRGLTYAVQGIPKQAFACTVMLRRLLRATASARPSCLPVTDPHLFSPRTARRDVCR